MDLLEQKRIAAGKYKLDRSSPTGWMNRPGPPPVSVPVDCKIATRVKGPTICAKEFIVHKNQRLAIPYKVPTTGYKDPKDASNRLDPFFYRTKLKIKQRSHEEITLQQPTCQRLDCLNRTNSIAFAPLASRTDTVGGITLPARVPTTTDLEFAHNHRRKDQAASRRNHMPLPDQVAPPHRHYMTTNRLRHRPVKSTVEQVNPGIAAQLASRERRRIALF